MAGSDLVRSYYDTNSRRFASWGPGKTSRAIHREVWGEGVESAREATLFVDTLIGDVIEDELVQNTSLHILDLGCGLAGTLSSLAVRFPSLPRLTGITISPVQVNLSREAIHREGLASRIEILEADFHRLPGLDSPDLAYAIEAFVHARDPRLFFQQVQRAISDDGKLILIDDFLTNVQIPGDERPIFDRLIGDFSTGWHAPNLLTVDAAIASARKEGFRLEWQMDLTRHLRIGRRRDRFLDSVYRLAGSYFIQRPYMRGLMGGAALQRAIARGWIKYAMLVFSKTPSK